mmetsp:Transcript_7348/g.15900  ORF Transcript_7348/g.15900 Transcript_7348/m.15900 type:complete len:225 (-) Transcript_7348:1392-2066(-)
MARLQRTHPHTPRTENPGSQHQHQERQARPHRRTGQSESSPRPGPEPGLGGGDAARIQQIRRLHILRHAVRLRHLLQLRLSPRAPHRTLQQSGRSSSRSPQTVPRTPTTPGAEDGGAGGLGTRAAHGHRGGGAHQLRPGGHGHARDVAAEARSGRDDVSSRRRGGGTSASAGQILDAVFGAQAAQVRTENPQAGALFPFEEVSGGTASELRDFGRKKYRSGECR